MHTEEKGDGCGENNSAGITAVWRRKRRRKRGRDGWEEECGGTHPHPVLAYRYYVKIGIEVTNTPTIFYIILMEAFLFGKATVPPFFIELG